jgi:uncharacterized protein (DUF885 family)
MRACPISSIRSTRSRIARDAEAYLARLSEFARALDQNSERQRTDAAAGVFAPDFALDLALGQLQALRGKPAAETVLVKSIVGAPRRRVSPETGAGGPKAGDYRRVPGARPADRPGAAAPHEGDSKAGIWRLKQGEAYYRMRSPTRPPPI